MVADTNATAVGSSSDASSADAVDGPAQAAVAAMAAMAAMAAIAATAARGGGGGDPEVPVASTGDSLVSSISSSSGTPSDAQQAAQAAAAGLLQPPMPWGNLVRSSSPVFPGSISRASCPECLCLDSDRWVRPIQASSLQPAVGRPTSDSVRATGLGPVVSDDDEDEDEDEVDENGRESWNRRVVEQRQLHEVLRSGVVCVWSDPSRQVAGIAAAHRGNATSLSSSVFQISWSDASRHLCTHESAARYEALMHAAVGGCPDPLLFWTDVPRATEPVEVRATEFRTINSTRSWRRSRAAEAHLMTTVTTLVSMGGWRCVPALGQAKTALFGIVPVPRRNGSSHDRARLAALTAGGHRRTSRATQRCAITAPERKKAASKAELQSFVRRLDPGVLIPDDAVVPIGRGIVFQAREVGNKQSTIVWNNGVASRLLPRFLLKTLLQGLPWKDQLGRIETPAQALSTMADALFRHAVGALVNTQSRIVQGADLPCHPGLMPLPAKVTNGEAPLGNFYFNFRSLGSRVPLDPFELTRREDATIAGIRTRLAAADAVRDDP